MYEVTRNGVAFGVKANYVLTQVKIKLAIELPLKGRRNSNDVALFFKICAAVAISTNFEIRLLKWDKSTTKNPMSKAIDIVYDEDTISKCFSGMKIKQYQERIIGFTKIVSPVQVAQIKKSFKLFPLAKK